MLMEVVALRWKLWTVDGSKSVLTSAPPSLPLQLKKGQINYDVAVISMGKK